MPARQLSFRKFYADHYLPDHKHPANIALHIAGTFGSAAFAIAALASPMPWLALLYPVVHAAPGLVGHRLFDRNRDIGDVRFINGKFPNLWFIAANHILTASLLRDAVRKIVRI
jgi:hypothetical protein